MANITQYVTFAIITVRILLQVQALILIVLVAVIFYKISTTQVVELDTDHELPPASSEDQQSLEPAVTTPAFTRPRPPLRRRNCFVPGPNGLASQPLLSSDSEFEPATPTTSDSEEGYETAPEDAAPAMTMAEKRALAYFEDRLRQHRESVSSETSAHATAVQKTSLTDALLQIREDHSDVEEDTEMVLQRRNVKMREEGVRVKVDYFSQLTSLKPAPAPRSAPAVLSSAATGDLRGGASEISLPPSSSSGSCPSTTPPLSGLHSPAPTPCNGLTGITTPDHAPGHASVLPTSGQAGEVLDRIDEKLLGIPADVVSRRLLRDGRAILSGSKRRPRGISSAESNSAQGTPAPVVEAELQTSKSGYPSEMME